MTEIERLAARVVELEALLKDVRDGSGCQPGYIHGLTLQRIASALAAQPKEQTDD